MPDKRPVICPIPLNKRQFLVASKEEMEARNWKQCDFVLVTGDAYVDHPSFAAALIGRVLEQEGYRVAILAQPSFQDEKDFMRFGRPKLAYLLCAGNMDSMVCHYSVAKKRRKTDYYSPGGEMGLRPDRATIVYANLCHKAYADVPIILGGVEASLRRFAHYDYWDNRIRHSILEDAGADLLIYGMGENTIRIVAQHLKEGAGLLGIPGTCTMQSEKPSDALLLPSYREISQDKEAYARCFALQYKEQDPIRGRKLAQKHEKKYLIQEKPAMPLNREELDQVYALPFLRAWHPMYDAKGGIPGFAEVKFSITSTRGCFGNCAFCSLPFHQGRIVQSRSIESILAEAKELTTLPDFKGYIHDVGGPTANFRHPSCKQQLKNGMCANRTCLSPKACPNLEVDHKEITELMKRLRSLPRVKKVFIRSGLRYDYLMLDKDETFLKDLINHHISGQLKVAPEHVSENVLRIMGKSGCGLYRSFVHRYEALNQQLHKNQYLVPYFISSHPGCGLHEAIELAEYLRDIHHQPEQVQDFYPTPGTLATAMYYTGLHPLTMEKVYVAKNPHEKAMQRALMQYKDPKMADLVKEALEKAGRRDLIGSNRKHCLIGNQNERPKERTGNYKGNKKTVSGPSSKKKTEGVKRKRSI